MTMTSWIAALLLSFALYAAGYVVIRCLNLNLPMPKSFKEQFLRTFWIYRSVDKRKVIANKMAWLVVVFVTYLIVTSIFL
jgi:hypothetical protein